MTSRKNNWIIFLAIGIILFIVIWHYYRNFGNLDTEKEEDPDSDRMSRIAGLEKEKEILIKHEQKNIDLEQKVKDQSEILWKKMIRYLILFFVGLNLIYLLIYFLIYQAFPFEGIITFYSIFVVVFTLGYAFISLQVFSLKSFIFVELREHSYKLVAGFRDAEYYKSRMENIQDRIDQIDLEIEQLTQKNNQLK